VDVCALVGYPASVFTAGGRYGLTDGDRCAIGVFLYCTGIDPFGNEGRTPDKRQRERIPESLIGA